MHPSCCRAAQARERSRGCAAARREQKENTPMNTKPPTNHKETLDSDRRVSNSRNVPWASPTPPRFFTRSLATRRTGIWTTPAPTTMPFFSRSVKRAPEPKVRRGFREVWVVAGGRVWSFCGRQRCGKTEAEKSRDYYYCASTLFVHTRAVCACW